MVITVDIDECVMGTDECDRNAVCINLHGAYLCRCNNGYFGTGYTCKSKVNTCLSSTLHILCTYRDVSGRGARYTR